MQVEVGLTSDAVNALLMWIEMECFQRYGMLAEGSDVRFLQAGTF